MISLKSNLISNKYLLKLIKQLRRVNLGSEAYLICTECSAAWIPRGDEEEEEGKKEEEGEKGMRRRMRSTMRRSISSSWRRRSKVQCSLDP